MVDLYEVLQVHPRAEADVIRAAFRALARKHHPDAGGDPRRMMALSEAWQVLGDKRSRARYDAARAAAAARVTIAANDAGVAAAARAAAAAAPSAARPAGAAGCPVGGDEVRHRPPSRDAGDGTVLDFGRYAGWSIRDLARQDPNYLEWLKRTSIGRRLVSEIESQLAAVEIGRPVPAPRVHASRFRRPIFGRA